MTADPSRGRPPADQQVDALLRASAQRFGAGTTYTAETRRPAAATQVTAIPSPDWHGVGPDAPANGSAAPKKTNVVGGIALTVSVIGSLCAGVALFTLARPPVASGVLLIVSWVLLPIAFILGISGSILPGRAKASSIAAMLISVGGGVASAYVTMGMLLTMGLSAVPN